MINLNIVTVTKNNLFSLKKTLNSVLFFSEKTNQIRINHLIQDGQSEDGTIEFIKIFKKNITSRNYQINFTSSSDTGIFDAMTKATKNLKEGDLVLYLNSGDLFSPSLDIDSFCKYLRKFLISKELIVFFRSRNIYKNVQYFMPPLKIKSSVDFGYWVKKNTPVHQSIIFKSTNKCPLNYINSFIIQADTYLIYKIIAQSSRPLFFNIEICHFELGGLSGNYKNFSKVFTQTCEQVKIMQMRGQNALEILFTIIMLFGKFILHSIFNDFFTIIHAYINKVFKSI